MAGQHVPPRRRIGELLSAYYAVPVGERPPHGPGQSLHAASASSGGGGAAYPVVESGVSATTVRGGGGVGDQVERRTGHADLQLNTPTAPPGAAGGAPPPAHGGGGDEGTGATTGASPEPRGGRGAGANDSRTTTVATAAAGESREEEPEWANLDGEHYDVRMYMSRVMAQSGVQELLETSNKLSEEIRAYDSDIQMLVYENYSKFIDGTDAIKQLRGRIESMEGDMAMVTRLVGEIHQTHGVLSSKINVRAGRIEVMSGLLLLLLLLLLLPPFRPLSAAQPVAERALLSGYVQTNPRTHALCWARLFC
eukprot:GHVU01178097.1.p1 GENE.GHVU01178097.1~~GHVU01178097.1.p1  ORF type:complete len:309 (+),score=47.52 GHVU01178097.1:519-1445(+)